MPQVRIRERNQVTLPMAITTAAGLNPNDALEVSFMNGIITMVPVNDNKPKQSILDFVGTGKGRWGKTAKEMDAYLSKERDSWER